MLKFWNSLGAVGTSEAYTSTDNARITLVNLLALIAIAYFLVCGIIRLLFDLPLTAIGPFIAAGLMSIVILLNYGKLHLLAKLTHYLSLCIIITFLGIIHGPKDAAEYCLWITCIIGLMYFDNLYILGILWLVNFLSFWGVKYTHDHLEIPIESKLDFSSIYLTTTFFALFLIIYYFKKNNQDKADLLNEQKKDVAIQKEKSESLLLNILPESVAEELKTTGRNEPVHYEMATVLFADFKEFTKISQKLTPSILVEKLNSYFTAFDEIIEKYNIEKIKTIGDAYLCAGGVPLANNTNAIDAVKAALELQAYVKKRKEELKDKDDFAFELRIGIHTGPVIACVVGKSKFAYDIWGETVNTAARLETTSEVGEINISEYTHKYVKDQFKVRPRGKVEAKHLGMIDMYFVEGPIAKEVEIV